MIQKTVAHPGHWNFHSITSGFLLEVSFPTQQGVVIQILQPLFKIYRYRVRWVFFFTWLGVTCFVVFPALA